MTINTTRPVVPVGAEPEPDQTTGAPDRQGGIRVTVTDTECPDESETVEIMDDYVLICAGRCELTHMQVSTAKDGTQTHVVTIKEVRRSEGHR